MYAYLSLRCQPIYLDQNIQKRKTTTKIYLIEWKKSNRSNLNHGSMAHMLDNNHWAYRALNENEDKGTPIDNNELLDFLNLAKSTFALFQAEAGGRLRHFYICISGK
jgi:hypothetical protein